MATQQPDSNNNYRCGHCNLYKPLAEFFKPPKNYRSNRSQYCKDCTATLGRYSRYSKKLTTMGPEAFKAKIEKDEKDLNFKKSILEKYLNKEAVYVHTETDK